VTGSLRLFNTLTRRVDEFNADGPVGLYVCGVTPYDTTHVGHARTYLVFDVLVRQLMHLGHRVNYIQNITDVDDSILERARDLDESYRSLGDRYTAIYMEDLAALGILPASAYPRATGAIPEIQEVIRRLLATGHAYRVEGDVYLSVSKLEHYGELSRLERDEMMRIEADQNGSTVGDERKRDPLDLLLWRAAPSGEAAWDSPWGPGRPGWHIECSTLAFKHLGKALDIHGGGSDLIFPHHEAEIAQSEATTGHRPFARFWVHVEMARLDGHKMAKSAGNMVFVRDLLTRWTSDALRVYLLSTHYREPLDFDERKLSDADDVAREVTRTAHAHVEHPGAEAPWLEWRGEFDHALENDLDTPAAIEVLRGLRRALMKGEITYRGRAELRALASRLGLSLER
jgi:L-cysteine:1D-myo-inositol 2-amino-2-deoxy-alpha-D-glucopyranoside ligase